MKLIFKYHWIYNANQSVWHGYSLIIEGIIRFEHKKSILFEFRKDQESHISYQIIRIVAEKGISIFNEWQIGKNSLNNKFEINELRRVP